MTNELRNKIADVVYETLNVWEPLGKDDESSFVAQAIIDNLGLVTYENETHVHVAGKWEKK